MVIGCYMKLILISLLLFVGCSSKQVVKQEVESFRDTNLPFSFEIKEEANDGTSLYLNAQVSAYQPWGQDEVLVHLSGLVNGEVVSEYFYSLSGLVKTQYPNEDLVGQTFSARSLLFSIPLAGQTDYQVELLWGSDAKALQKNKIIIFSDLELFKKSCQNCYADALKLKLVNNGSDTIDSIKLGIGYVWLNSDSSLDLSGIIPQNEQQFTVNSLELSNNVTKELEFAVAPEIAPASGEGKYIPIVRVIEYVLE